MEKILIVSNYYPPEKGAAANRIEQLALQLSQRNYEVSVVCPLGNYPEGKLFEQYRGKFSATETLQNILVKRLWIYPSNSKNIAKRILSILSFSSVLFCYLLFAKIPKKVIVQSPPLLLSFLSVLALKIRGRKIILNVSDLWPQAALELGVMKQGSFSHKFALQLEKFIYKNASIVLGQSKEILERVLEVIPNQKTALYRNFPVHSNTFQFEATTNKIQLFYAGLMGVAQGVLEMVTKIDLPENTELHLFGDGAERDGILDYLKQNPQKKIHFHGMIDRKVLHQKLQSCDVALVPLKTRIFGSVPSKIFEYGALGMPLLYSGGGEGEDLVRENQLGWIASVGNYEEFNAALRKISAVSPTEFDQMKVRILKTAQKEFDLKNQFDGLIENDVF